MTIPIEQLKLEPEDVHTILLMSDGREFPSAEMINECKRYAYSLTCTAIKNMMGVK